ncbi:MAG: JAB domain-containing protein [Eubacteriales bacterium]
MSEQQPQHYGKGHRARIKQRFATAGLLGWHDHEILELTLFYAIPQGDVKPLAHALIEKFGSFAGVLDAPKEALMTVKGVGEHTASFLIFCSSMSGAYLASRTKVGTIVNHAGDALPHLAPHFHGQTNEMVYGLFLDGKNQVLGVRKLAEGSINSTDVNVRRLVEEAVFLRALNVYLAHNHVASLALPSFADVTTTQIFSETLQQVGLCLVDHLIFVEDDMISLRESNRHNKIIFYEPRRDFDAPV